MTIRVLPADGQALLRATFRVVAEAADGAEAVALVRQHRPDVVVVDIRMPGTDGLAVTATIHLARARLSCERSQKRRRP